MKNFVTALDWGGRGCAFLHQKFQRKSMDKRKAGIFDGPQIRKLIKDTSFDEALNPAEHSAWLSLVRHCKLPWQPQKFPVSSIRR